jgi:hypothetical protein
MLFHMLMIKSQLPEEKGIPTVIHKLGKVKKGKFVAVLSFN